MQHPSSQSNAPFLHLAAAAAAVAFLAAAAAATPLVGCGGERGTSDSADSAATGDVVGGEEARRAVVAAIGERVILPRLRAFATQAADLATACEALATAERAVDGPAATELEAARADWIAAIATWQELELFQLGPAGAMGSVAGGQGLRARIYAWPLTSPCRVDQETLAGALLAPGALANAPANVRGLAALEYLLFSPSSANACAASSTINTDGSWAALSEEDVRTKRADYAAAAARDVVASAELLRDAWEPSGGDFLGELTGAGTRPTYPSVQAALNALSDALFYLDKETKDMKLAGPLGILGCAAATCPELVESRYAGRSAAHIVGNIAAFELAFFGGARGDPEALGLDDLLRAAGATALADDMGDKLALARARAEAIADPLEDAIAADKPQVEAAHAALADLTRLLKTQLLSVLDLELPERAEGDND